MERRSGLFAAATVTIAWIALAAGGASCRAQSSLIGQWTGVQTWPVEAIHTTLLPTGKVLFWQSWRESVGLWDPVTNLFSTAGLPPSNHNVFCSGHAWLADGRLLVAGGHVENGVGSHRADIYNPFTNRWANADSTVADVRNMGANNLSDLAATGKRWYPSATTLGNGDVLVLSGDVNAYGNTNRNTQIYRAATNTWDTLPGAPRTTCCPNIPACFSAPTAVFSPSPTSTTIPSFWISPAEDPGPGSPIRSIRAFTTTAPR
jgi:galactose oxidase